MIRNVEYEDLDIILDIYEKARQYMKENGNPNQWKNISPALEDIKNDIEKKQSYVVIHEDKIVGVFAFIIGEDPTYKVIDGAWLNGDDDYGTIHRIASIGKGVFDEAITYAFSKVNNVRIDTHENNKTMRHLITSRGFKYCGVIICHDGTPRLAYQKVSN